MTIPDLIARVEAAEGPDRELDEAVYEALGFCNHKRTKYYCIEDGNDTDSGYTCLDCGKDTYGAKRAPTYTASLDAVMTLVPEEWFWLRKCQSTMTVVQPATEQKGWATHTDGKGATPALALLAACLRARFPDSPAR